jgi:hypothetical protein
VFQRTEVGSAESTSRHHLAMYLPKGFHQGTNARNNHHHDLPQANGLLTLCCLLAMDPPAVSSARSSRSCRRFDALRKVTRALLFQEHAMEYQLVESSLEERSASFLEIELLVDLALCGNSLDLFDQ